MIQDTLPWSGLFFVLRLLAFACPVICPTHALEASGLSQKPPTQSYIERVEIIGNQRIQAETILGLIRSRPGSPYDPEIVESDVRSLLSSSLFANVRLKVKNGFDQANAKTVVFSVTEKPPQQSTGYPPMVYEHFFFACALDEPCTRTDSFRVDPVPEGCCVLIVTNGDGRGTDEAHSYKVFLNGKRVVPTGHARNAQAAVKLVRDNTLKIVLTGEPHSKVFVLIAYDPRQSK